MFFRSVDHWGLRALRQCLVLTDGPEMKCSIKQSQRHHLLVMVSVVFSASQMNERRPRRFCGVSGVTQLVLEALLEPRCQALQLWVF